MNAAATRQAAASRPWSAWIPRDRVDARDNPLFAAATDRQRVLLLALEFLWKSRPYTLTSNAELADITGWDQRKVQRVLEELERDGFIHRELIPGRTDRVSGRHSVTGRIGIIALARLTEQAVATKGKELDQIIASMHHDRDRRQPHTVPFRSQHMGARQICHQVHDNFGDGCTTNLSSALLDEEQRQENTTTTSVDRPGPSHVHESSPSSSSSVLDPESEETKPPDAELPGEVAAVQDPAVGTSTHAAVLPPAPIETPPAPAVLPVAADLPAELVAAAAAAIPGASRAWVRSLLRHCGEYGLDLAMLVLAWVKVQRAGKPARYAWVALSGWLNKLRAGEMTLEDVRAEVQGRPGPRSSPRPFDPSVCLARLESHGWTIVALGADQFIRSEIPGRGSPLWRNLPADLRQEVEAHKAELKAYVLRRAAERGQVVGRGA